VVSLEFLALVRFGLRRADDPRVVNSLAVADAVLKVETPSGPAWHRYTGDGYGEHDDGSPFDGTGTGRAWPLLTGERGHVALLLGEPVEPYLRAMARMASTGGMLPEQVWDAPDLPERRLFAGRPTGAAMPLVWAHAEYVKLAASSALGYPVDRPWRVWERYRGLAPQVPWVCWRIASPVTTMPAGRLLRLELLEPASVRWTADNWQSWRDDATLDRGLGVHVLDLPVRDLPAGTMIAFTMFWTGANRWEGRNFTVIIQTRDAD
jgi:glucoamylase